MKQLEVNSRDQLVSVTKAVAGAFPFVGALVAETLDAVVPNLRFDRVVCFLKTLEDRVTCLDNKMLSFEKNLGTEQGLDIFEEGMIQASRSVSEERKDRLARLVAKSLTADEVKYEESKKLLNIYRDLTDPEIVWLIFYSLNPTLERGPHTKWMEKHPEILNPISRQLGVPQEQQERAALQDSYKATLLRLGLTEERNGSTGLTMLGRMLVAYISDEIFWESENSIFSQNEQKVLDASGSWHSSLGIVKLSQSNNEVIGKYLYKEVDGNIRGEIIKDRIVFQWTWKELKGVGYWKIHDGQLRGRWFYSNQSCTYEQLLENPSRLDNLVTTNSDQWLLWRQ